MDIHADHPDFDRLVREGRVVAYFGYGSLVNKATLRTKFLAIRRAEVRGWRRVWLPRRRPEAALLSVRPERDHVTQGVVVYDLADHLALVDEREAGYRRCDVPLATVSIEAAPAVDAPLYLYEARATPAAAGEGVVILQSYLDAVLQGFLSLYGRDGLDRFIRDTDGFRATILLDRSAPLYPRAVGLATSEAALFDSLLKERGSRFVAAR